MPTRRLLLWTMAATTTSCAIVANLGDRTLGDPFGEEGGVEEGGDEGTNGESGPTDGGDGIDVVHPPFDAPPGCVVDNFPASLLEAQLYIAVDTSASMSEPLPSGPTRIDAERQAVNAFVHEPLSASLFAMM